jgi:hypothetical protein
LKRIQENNGYPHFILERKLHWSEDTFSGWMLQSYRSKIAASSEDAGHEANFAVDENIRTCWAAEVSDLRLKLTLDLEVLTEIRALQINFAEHHCRNYADTDPKGCARFIIETSDDKQNWQLILDKSNNSEDKAHIYEVLNNPCVTRYLRLTILAVKPLDEVVLQKSANWCRYDRYVENDGIHLILTLRT